MNRNNQPELPPALADTTELLILADGRILVHNLTPQFAQLLSSLNTNDKCMSLRAATGQKRSDLPPASP